MVYIIFLSTTIAWLIIVVRLMVLLKNANRLAENANKLTENANRLAENATKGWANAQKDQMEAIARFDRMCEENQLLKKHNTALLMRIRRHSDE